MLFRYYSHIKSAKILKEIKELLELYDQEFVPPLSSRISTTQTDLLPNTETGNGIDDYFAEISKQSAVVAVENGKVVAFLSFKYDYICEHISDAFLPNLYVSTIIVDREYRHKGIAGKLYDTLIMRFPKRHIFVRTWSTNRSHIRILLSREFHEHCVLTNDRGNDIDTNYYRYDPKKIRFSRYIQQYRLGNNIFFGVLLFLFTGAFIALWLWSKVGIMHELALAIATSLMASLLCLGSDTFLKIRESKNDRYINALKNYGIGNLQFYKNELLEAIIPHCRDEIWISGYRLVMTSKATFRQALVTACQRSHGLKIKLLVVPPWTEAYQLVYGQEDVTTNYLLVLRDLIECREKYKLDLAVHFSQKPLFSDTYKVDDRFVTGPYLHCADKYNNRITAKDFFSFDITAPNTELYKIFYNDYMTLWNEADKELDIDEFSERIKGISDFTLLTEDERVRLLAESCVSVDATVK